MEDLVISKEVDRGDWSGQIVDSRQLIFSDYLLLGALSLGIFLLISRPIFGTQLSNSPLKHIPLALFLPTLAFHQVGRALFCRVHSNNAGLIYCLWPLCLLGSYTTVGSLLARFVFDEKETFLTLGVYLLSTPLFFIWGRASGGAGKMVSPLVFLWGTSSMIAVAGAIARYGQDESLHEIEFWVLPFFLYSYLVAKTMPGRILSLMMLACASILTQKLTGYAIGIGAIGYISSVRIHRSVEPRWRPFILGVIFVALLIGLGLLTLGFMYFQQYLPSGNVGVRLHQYELALDSFFKSPIWGKAYTGSSGEIYIEYTKSFNLPTHSDLLDILKQGGIIAFTLWVVGMYKCIKLFFQCASRTIETSPFFHAMVYITVAIIFSSAVNPLLLKPPFAFVIFGVLSLAMSIATNYLNEKTDAV